MSPPAVVKDDVCHGAGAVHDEVYVLGEAPGPELKGELLHVRGPGEPQIQVQSRRAFCSRTVALGIPLVQALLSSRQGYPWGYSLRQPTDGAGRCRCLGTMGRRPRVRGCCSAASMGCPTA